MGKVQIDEAEHGRLVEAAGQVETLTGQVTELQGKLEEALAKIPAGPKGPRTMPQQIAEQLEAQKHEMDILVAREGARDIIGEELAESWIPPSSAARLSTELMQDLPLKEDGKLDAVALRDRCVEARDRAELEAAETLDAAGFGRPKGVGHTTAAPVGGDATKYQESIEGALTGAFGLSEAESKTAVKGR